MRLLGLLVYLALVDFSLGGWSEPHTIYTGNSVLRNYWSYMDASTGKTHILFSMADDHQFAYHYMAVSATGEKTEPKRLLELGINETRIDSASITGSNDGKHVFVIVTALPEKESTYSEIYFMESNSDGLFFTDPIIPRSNDIDDKAGRTAPSLVRLKSNRLIISYNKSMELTYTSRIPYSTVWSHEVSFNQDQWIFIGHSMVSFTNEDNKDSVCIATLYYDIELRKSHMMLSLTKTNGMTWEHYEHPLNTSRPFYYVSLAYSPKTQQISFSPMSWKDNNLTVLYQRKDGETKIVAAFPVGFTAVYPSIEVANIRGSSYLFHFTDSAFDKPAERLLIQIPEEKPYAFERLVAPVLAKDDSALHLHSFNDTLFAIGIANTQILGANYTFT